MKSGLIKRILAMGMMVMMLSGDVLPVMAETVSGGDAVVTEQDIISDAQIDNTDVNVDSEETEEVENTETTEVTEEIVEDEAAAEDVVTEETVAEDSTTVSGGDAEVDTEVVTDTVSGGDLVEIEEEDVPLAAILTEFAETINGVTIKMSAPEDAFEEGTTMVVTEIAPQEVEVAIENVEKETQTVVRRYRAFDIKLVDADGIETQPLNDRTVTVTFEGDMLLPEEGESVEVFHVEDTAATSMGARVVEETVVTEEAVVAEETTETEETVETVTETTEVVEMETTHFSVYVVAITAGVEDYTITYRQYDGECGSEDAIEIYRKSETVYNNISKKEFTLQELVETGRLAAGANYQLNSIVVAEEGKEEAEWQKFENIAADNSDEVVEINISKNTEISFYYSPVNKGLISNDVTMFDYDVVGSYQELTNIDIPRSYIEYNYGNQTHKIAGDYDVVDKLKLGYGTFNNCLITKRESQIVIYTNVRIDQNWGDDRIESFDNTYWLGNGDYIWNLSVDGNFYSTVKIEVENSQPRLMAKIGSINDQAYNSDGSLKSDKYLAMGLAGIHGINAYTTKNVDGTDVTLNINANNAWQEDWSQGYAVVTQHGDYAILPGLVQDFASNDTSYENLVMANGIYEPGYFTGTEFPGKRVFDNERFKLNFAQIGDTYTLVNAVDTVAQSTTNTFKYAYDENKTNYALKDNYQDISASFFPMENVNGEVNDQTNESGAHNCYFGMRYDFSFKIGDYVGPINYTFAGDDDMWVFLDGKLVMDLGGMHSAYPTAPHYNANDYAWNNQMTDSTDEYSVNLWKALLNMPNASDEELQARIDALTDAEKDADHQVTVLYMERGGYDSSCFMQFVIPNVVPMESVIQKPADLELTKVDSETGAALSGATFELTKYTNNRYETIDVDFGTEGVIEVVSDSNGKLRFRGLEEGYYKMVETKAPSGYYLSTDEWNVVATASGDNEVSVTVTGLTDGKIENIKMDIALDSEKKATLVDWEKRVYKIDLKAFAQVESISNTKNANVLLLVDASGSMIFTDAQISAEQLDTGKIYFTRAFVSPNDYNAYGDGYKVSSSVAARLLSTAKGNNKYYGIPNSGSYVFYVDNGANSGWYKKNIDKLDDYNALNTSGATKVDPTQITLYTNRSEIFVNAAEAFVNGLSEDSNVAVVTFGDQSGASKKSDFTSLRTGKADVINDVNAATGVYYTGTYAASGFNMAAGMYETLGDYDDSYMVFFTDGQLNDSQNAISAATTLKNRGVEIFAIGVGEGNSDSLYQIASSDEHVKTCTNMADVANALTSLGITAPGNLENVTMVDEISPYFELCDQDGNVITSLEGATISYKDGKQVITWSNQTVALGDDGLAKTIYIKAKDNFAGGNYVPTNGSFTVTAPNEDPSGQDTPYVNVRTNIKAGEAEDTIFLGENLENYFSPEQQTAVSGARYDDNGNIIAVLNEDGKEFTNLDYVNVTVQWKDANGKAVSVEEIRKATPETETKYYATITVSPKYAANSAEAQEAAKSMQMASDDTLYAVETIQADPDGVYTVKVVTGQIVVTKKIKESDIDYNDGDPIFTFQIEKDGLTQTRMVRFAKDVVKSLDVVDGYVSLTVKFDNLEKGTYNVTELDTMGYTLESKTVDAAETNCGYNDSIAFAIGQTSIDNVATDLDATKGAAIYTNKVTSDRNESDKDMVVNQVVIENGKVVIKKQVVPVQE